MSDQYEISRDAGFVRIMLAPSITWGGMKQALEEVARILKDDPQPRVWVYPDELPPQFEDEFPLENLWSLVESAFKLKVFGRGAVVARNAVIYGKVRQVLTLKPEYAEIFRTFRSEKDALDWLGLESD